LDSLGALVDRHVTIKTNLASVFTVTALIELNTIAFSALLSVADAVDITLEINDTHLTDRKRKFALMVDAGKVITTLVAKVGVTLCAIVQAAAQALLTDLVTSAMVVLCAAIVEIALHNTLTLDASNQMSTKHSRKTVICGVASGIPSLFHASSIDAVERESAAVSFVVALRTIDDEITHTLITFISTSIIVYEAVIISPDTSSNSDANNSNNRYKILHLLFTCD